MPNPHKGESKEDYMKRCVPILINEGKEQDQAVAICSSMHKEHTSKKESRFANKGVLSFKEILDELVVKGYIATTHFDGQDIITKSALDKWADEINQGVPRANKVSINHNREKHVAGVGLKGTAKVEQFTDGNYGLYVDTLVDKTRQDYNDIKYRVNNNLLDSFSIEYIAPKNPKMENGARILDENTVLHGWTLASRPMNENAVMIKELLIQGMNLKEKQSKNVDKEVNKMETETKETKMSDEDMKLLNEAKETKKRVELKNLIMESLKDSNLQKEIFGKETQKAPLLNESKEVEDKKVEIKQKMTQEEKEYVAMFTSSKPVAIEEKFRRAGLLAEQKGMVWVEGFDKLGYKTSSKIEGGIKFKNFGTNGTKLEFKGLGITTNQNADTDYLLSAAELRDVFDPVIYDVLNQSVTTWGVLAKDDYSGKGNNQVQFIIRNGANATATFYTNNSVSTSQSGLLKLQTKFKKVQVGVSIDGDMIAAAKGGTVGDVFATHIRYATEDILHVANVALYAEVGLETAAACIGFEYITDSAGNATLYNLTRASYTGLVPTSAADTYINGSSARISIDNLRLAIEQATKQGAKLSNLVFFTHPTQERLFKGLFDANMLMAMNMNPRFGFEGRIHFEGVPIFADKDCNSDDWFLVDLESHRVAIWLPPTLEMLGKRSDAEEGFVKMYFATYNTSPNRMVQIYGNATS